MADTVLKISVEAGKDFFHVYDNTGKYDKKTNSEGWGIPNSLISDVTEAVVRVYLPNSEEYSTVDVFPSLPNTTCVGFEIIPEDISLTEFPPGVYRFDYVVTLSNGTILSQNCYYFYDSPLKCCISKKKSNTNPNDASSDLAKLVIELETLLKNAQWCSCSGKIDCAQEISDYIWAKCGCCC